MHLPPGFGKNPLPNISGFAPPAPVQPGFWGESAPALLRVWCPQCHAKFTLVAYEGPDGPYVLLLLAQGGRTGTPNTPTGVAYYVDQTERAKPGGALSAALAMHRAALERLLHQQGFTDTNMSDKIKALRTEKGSGSARPWVAEVDDVALEMLKRLADGTFHPDGEGISRQAAIDADLLRSVELVDLGPHALGARDRCRPCRSSIRDAAGAPASSRPRRQKRASLRPNRA